MDGYVEMESCVIKMGISFRGDFMRGHKKDIIILFALRIKTKEPINSILFCSGEIYHPGFSTRTGVSKKETPFSR